MSIVGVVIVGVAVWFLFFREDTVAKEYGADDLLQNRCQDCGRSYYTDSVGRHMNNGPMSFGWTKCRSCFDEYRARHGLSFCTKCGYVDGSSSYSWVHRGQCTLCVSCAETNI